MLERGGGGGGGALCREIKASRPIRLVFEIKRYTLGSLQAIPRTWIKRLCLETNRADTGGILYDCCDCATIHAKYGSAAIYLISIE